jgi:triphosphoribosyl-dephospho-CoA synthase
MPTLFDVALPALQHAERQQMSPQLARLDCLMQVIARLDDTNLAHRAGLAGLRRAQRLARAFVERGGAAAPDALDRAADLQADFVAHRLSPGGAADILAAACWLQRVCRP